MFGGLEHGDAAIVVGDQNIGKAALSKDRSNPPELDIAGLKTIYSLSGAVHITLVELVQCTPTKQVSSCHETSNPLTAAFEFRRSLAGDSICKFAIVNAGLVRQSSHLFDSSGFTMWRRS